VDESASGAAGDPSDPVCRSSRSRLSAIAIALLVSSCNVASYVTGSIWDAAGTARPAGAVTAGASMAANASSSRSSKVGSMNSSWSWENVPSDSDDANGTTGVGFGGTDGGAAGAAAESGGNDRDGAGVKKSGMGRSSKPSTSMTVTGRCAAGAAAVAAAGRAGEGDGPRMSSSNSRCVATAGRIASALAGGDARASPCSGVSACPLASALATVTPAPHASTSCRKAQSAGMRSATPLCPASGAVRGGGGAGIRSQSLALPSSSLLSLLSVLMLTGSAASGVRTVDADRESCLGAAALAVAGDRDVDSLRSARRSLPPLLPGRDGAPLAGPAPASDGEEDRPPADWLLVIVAGAPDAPPAVADRPPPDHGVRGARSKKSSSSLVTPASALSAVKAPPLAVIAAAAPPEAQPAETSANHS